ncbi:hypothetical protein H8K33_19225 [Undibacterium amnicola]|uniref:CPXCG motif-containing cysteine-rich protein n=1 Tax=Undibacterium amnicola TaxID=1834038 RepID=A0ABR6XXF0_9BURK|nr:hypothetical protein [Undibacterium amnicola]MBC3833647.1 hypothetical protein [Undibacterium amnicola]
MNLIRLEKTMYMPDVEFIKFSCPECGWTIVVPQSSDVIIMHDQCENVCQKPLQSQKISILEAMLSSPMTALSAIKRRVGR